MINLTDMELCMLEQLTYLDEEVAVAAGVNDNFGKINTEMINSTISEILAEFDDEALLRLASADLNTIRIHGYTVADMHNTRMANNDLVIDFGEGTGDRLVIQGFFNFNSNRDFNFVFDDETVLGQYVSADFASHIVAERTVDDRVLVGVLLFCLFVVPFEQAQNYAVSRVHPALLFMQQSVFAVSSSILISGVAVGIITSELLPFISRTAEV